MRNHPECFCVLILLFFATTNVSAEAAKRRPDSPRDRVITSPRFDPDAKKLELFAGIENGSFETKVIALGPKKGNVLISNKTSEPLTVEFPQTFVAVHVLKQFPFNNAPGNNGLGVGNQNGLLQGGQQQGGQQTVGGGLQQGNAQGNQNPFANGPGGNGNGFFSIPPERTIKVSYVSACLEHGKPDPSPRAKYRLVRTEDYTNDPVLQEIVAMVATGRLDSKAAQAAVWHRSNHMTWSELANKYSYTALGKVPYFRAKELEFAQQIVDVAAQRAGADKTNSRVEPSIVSVPTR